METLDCLQICEHTLALKLFLVHDNVWWDSSITQYIFLPFYLKYRNFLISRIASSKCRLISFNSRVLLDVGGLCFRISNSKYNKLEECICALLRQLLKRTARSQYSQELGKPWSSLQFNYNLSLIFLHWKHCRQLDPKFLSSTAMW